VIPRARPSFTAEELLAAFLPGRAAPARFEAELATHFGMAEAILFPYGRSAIHAALAVLAPPGGEVVQPAYNCAVVTHATVCAGMKPVFVDTGRDDPNQDPAAMAAAVSERTSAVVPTSIFGLSFDAAALVAAIRKRNPRALIVLDCAQSFDATSRGSMLARQGDVAVLAFGLGKPMTTLYGGALLTDRAEFAEPLRRYRDEFGRRRNPVEVASRYAYLFASWIALLPAVVPVTEWLEQADTPLRRHLLRQRSRDTIALPRDNEARTLAMEAAVGRRQLRRVRAFVARRRDIGRVYAERLAGLGGLELIDWGNESCAAIYAARLRDPAARPALLASVRRQGVQGGTVLDYVIPGLPCYRAAGHDPAAFPRAGAWAAGVVNFPNHPSMSACEVERVVRAVRRACGG